MAKNINFRVDAQINPNSEHRVLIGYYSAKNEAGAIAQACTTLKNGKENAVNLSAIECDNEGTPIATEIHQAKHDGRYSVTKEYNGNRKRPWTVRFEGTAVACAENELRAWEHAGQHKRDRNAKLSAI